MISEKNLADLCIRINIEDLHNWETLLFLDNLLKTYTSFMNGPLSFHGRFQKHFVNKALEMTKVDGYKQNRSKQTSVPPSAGNKKEEENNK